MSGTFIYREEPEARLMRKTVAVWIAVVLGMWTIAVSGRAINPVATANTAVAVDLYHGLSGDRNAENVFYET